MINFVLALHFLTIQATSKERENQVYLPGSGEKAAAVNKET